MCVRYFNTTGPCVPELHYMLPAEARLPEARPLVESWRYFVVHAPRQTGKTTTLSALARQLTAEGRVVALRFSCERGEASEDDYGAAELQVLGAIRRAAREAGLLSEFMPPDPWPDSAPGSRIYEALQDWAVACPLPLALFFDEIDALRGQSLISVLRQLRDGFTSKAHAFPASVVLCGLRDVRDYKAAAGGDPSRLGTASPFNIAVKSLRIGDFTADEVATLYKQHTAETAQEFTSEAVERVFALTQGQPWLVNALGLADVRLAGGVLGLLAEAEVGRNRDREQDADDHDHDQQFDQREALARCEAPPQTIHLVLLGRQHWPARYRRIRHPGLPHNG